METQEANRSELNGISETPAKRVYPIYDAYERQTNKNNLNLTEENRSEFSNIPAAPPIGVYHIYGAYLRCNNKNKVDLTVGVYQGTDSKPWMMPAILKAEKLLLEDEVTHSYMNGLGFREQCELVSQLVLGKDYQGIHPDKVLCLQTLGAAGALTIGGKFLLKFLNKRTVYFSNPTWGNHRLVFEDAGYSNIRYYRYWDHANRCLDFEGMCEDLKNASPGSVIILQPAAHNPTGLDPTRPQWQKIIDIIQKHKLFIFFDFPYQGFASGDTDIDAWLIRHVALRRMEFLCAVSFSKNCTLYGERIGNLIIVINNPAYKDQINSQLFNIILAQYMNPPRHGAEIVLKILKDNQLQQEWKENIKAVHRRIRSTRSNLRNKLEQLGTPGDWSHITSQNGMFCFTGLSSKQVKCLVNEYFIFMLENGRINISGLTEENLEYVATSISRVVKGV